MNRVLDLDEALRHGDLAITDDGGEPVPMNGWNILYQTPEKIMREERLSWKGRTFRVIRMERPVERPGEELDTDYLLLGLQKIRKELWTDS